MLRFWGLQVPPKCIISKFSRTPWGGGLTAPPHTPQLILGPKANFEVLPRAKNSKLCQEITYTHRTIPKDARSTKKPDINDFACTQRHPEGRTKLAILGTRG